MLLRAIVYGLLCIGLSATSGCFLVALGAGVGAGVAGVSFVKGEQVFTESVGTEAGAKAVAAALKDLGLQPTRTQSDALGGVVEARMSDDRPVKITLKRTPDDRTEFHIRVGLFGDEPLSLKIMEKIRSRLGQKA